MRLRLFFIILGLALALCNGRAVFAEDTINLSSLLPKNTGWLADADVDMRYRSASTGVHHQGYVNAVELDLQHSLVYKKTNEGNFFLQVIGENPPDQVSGKQGDIQIGEAYVTYRLPILTETDSTAYVKLGQFTLPFGLMPVYDTHLQILQTLYPEAIGERIDEGAEVEGRFYGVLDYRFSVTAGVGPNHTLIDPNRVVTFRLGRLFSTPYGTFNFGGSLLSGRLPTAVIDPDTGFAPTLPPSGRISNEFGFESKSRIGGDGQWNYRALTARGEAITGADGDNRVLGYFAEAEYRFAPGLTAVLARKYWDYGVDNSTSGDNAMGLTINYGNGIVIRTLYEEQRDVPESSLSPNEPMASTHLRHVFTVQLLLRF